MKGDEILDTNIKSLIIPRESDLVVANNTIYVCQSVDVIYTPEREIQSIDVHVIDYTPEIEE